MCIHSETYPHSQWGYAFPVSHIAIPSEDAYSFVILYSLGMRICLNGNGDVTYRECIPSPRMGMWLTRNPHPDWEWGCASPEMGMYGDVTHWECISSLGIGIGLTWNGDVTDWKCTSSPGMRMCLARNGDVPHQQWGRYSLRIHMLTGNGDMPHQKWGCASPEMGMCLTRNRDLTH